MRVLRTILESLDVPQTPYEDYQGLAQDGSRLARNAQYKRGLCV